MLLPVTVPLLVALYNKWLPGPADRLNLVIVVLPCVIACAVTLLLYPKNGRLRGPGSVREKAQGLIPCLEVQDRCRSATEVDRFPAKGDSG